METVTVAFDFDRSLKIYHKYYAYIRRLNIKRIPLAWLMGIGSVFLIIGLLTNVSLWLSLAIVVLGGTGICIAIVWLYYTIGFWSFSNRFKKDAHYSEPHFEFGFDKEGMSVKTEQVFSSIKWEMIASYMENDGDIYLVLRNGRLYDIISKSTLGKEKYDEFSSTLKLHNIPKH